MIGFRIHSKIVLGILCAFVASYVWVAQATAAGQITKQTKGKISKDTYTSPDADFSVVIPNAKVWGAHARDEGSNDVWQVIFTDDFGGFYRLLSLKNPSGEYNTDSVLQMKTYAEAFDKEVLQSARGREVRFMHVEKNGAEITVKKGQKQPDGSIQWDSMTPDLVTANAVFEANGHLYHLIAGVALTDINVPEAITKSQGVSVSTVSKMDQKSAIQMAKERLTKLMDGFQLGKPGR